MGRAIVASLLAMLLGCGGGDGGGADAGGSGGGDGGPAVEARVELGTGRTSFVPIPDGGGTLELIAGPQGGWHVDVSVRLYGFRIDGLLLSYQILRAGAVISMPRQFELREAIVVREGDHWLRAGDFVIFDITAPADVIGDTVTVRVVAEEPGGATDADERSVVIVDLE